jgi:PAS domain S-box-containing protein
LRQSGYVSLVALETAKSILDGLPDAAIILDRTFSMIAFNQPFAAMVGLRGANADGVGIAIDPFELLGTDPERDTERAKECLHKRTVIRLAEVQTKTETGGAYTMQVTFLPVVDGMEQPVFVMVIFRDVTAEAELQVRYREAIKKG